MMIDVKTDMKASESNTHLINALPGAAAVLDRQGELLICNIKWKSSAKSYIWYGGSDCTENYFERCQKAVQNGDDYALKILFGLRSVIDAEKERFDISIPAGGNRSRKWFKLSITPMGNNGDVLLLFEDVSKDMESMRTFRESSEIYSQHFNHTLAGIILGTPSGDILDVNPAACRILGYTRQELMEGGRELIVDKNSPQNKEMYKVRKEKTIYEGEKEYIHKNGTVITVEVSSLLYRNENGDIRTINTFRDKSKEKESIQNLIEERRFTKAAINSIPNAFFVINDEFELIQWNNSFFEELGYDLDAMDGSSMFDFVAPEDKERVITVVKEAFDTGTGHVITEVLSRQNGTRHYHFYGNTFESKGKKYLVCTGTDITDLLETEREKDKNYELISQLFEGSPLGMIMLRPDGRVAKVNESFARLFNYSKIEIIGENLDQLIVDESERRDNYDFNEAVFAGTVMRKEAIRYTSNGKPLNTIINTVPIFEGNKIVGAYGIYVDVTEQKELEVRIQQSLKEKDILLQEVHHRVKNNLAIIAGLLDLQIMEEDNQQMEYKLNEVRSRIFSIAKIHESLYEKEDVVQIRFDHYLESVLDALPQRSIKNGKEVTFGMNMGPVVLNLNQAVPFGLAVNELMNVIFMNKSGLKNMDVSLKENNGRVELSISGQGIITDEIKPGVGLGTFHQTLIKIFLAQINGTMELSGEERTEIKVFFTKMNIRGSSSSVLNTRELVSN